MKKLQVLTVLVVCLLIVSLAHAWKLPNPKKVPFEEATTMLNTPGMVQSWLHRYFKFDMKKMKRLPKKYPVPFSDEELWITTQPILWTEGLSYPSETYHSKKGLCFDAANFAAYCLYKAGYEVAVLSTKRKTGTKGKPYTHTVCVFKSKKNGKLYIAGDTRKLRKGTDIDGPYSSLQDAAEDLVRRRGKSLKYYFLGRKKFEGDTKFAGVQINGEKLLLSKDR